MDPQRVKIGLRIGLVLLGVAALVSAGVVVAQMSIPATEPGGEVTEIQNSFDSYLDAGVIIPENGLAASGEPFAWPEGIAPDDNPPEGAARTQGTNATDAPIFHYYMVSGSTLRGRSSTTEYKYDAAGCAHVTAGIALENGYILNTGVTLPDQAEIKYLRVYFKDTNLTKGVRGYITRYQPGIGPPPVGAGTRDLASAYSDSPIEFDDGYGFVVSNRITETVDNASYAYTLLAWPDDIGESMQICGLRIAYYLPQNNLAFLPAIKSR